jgi:hypothetical protein
LQSDEEEDHNTRHDLVSGLSPQSWWLDEMGKSTLAISRSARVVIGSLAWIYFARPEERFIC